MRVRGCALPARVELQRRRGGRFRRWRVLAPSADGRIRLRVRARRGGRYRLHLVRAVIDSGPVSQRDAPSFSPELFAFLRDLKANNDRTWFNANKGRYEEHVKEPALAFVEDIGYRLPQIAPHLVADKRSMFRIYRDTRFARDKSPYKTHVGIYFRHENAGDADTAGLYLHLEPRSVFLGAGIWHPGSPALKRIRDAIVARPDEWREALEAVAPHWRQADGEALKRAPTGYPADHPLVDDLKRKNFAILSSLKQAEATGRGFLDEVVRRGSAARPYMEFLSEALGVSY